FVFSASNGHLGAILMVLRVSALLVKIETCWVGQFQRVVSYVHILVECLRVFQVSTEEIRAHKSSQVRRLLARFGVVVTHLGLKFVTGEEEVIFDRIGNDPLGAKGVVVHFAFAGAAVTVRHYTCRLRWSCH